LEMMVALAILSLIGGLVTVQVKKMIDTHRFEGEVADLFIALQEAQVFAATYQTDLALELSVKSGAVSYRFSTDEPLSPHQLKQGFVSMPHVASIRFQESKAAALHLDIYSGGRIEPRGTLGFYQTNNEDKSLWFDLQYGQLLKFHSRKPPQAKQRVPARPK
jgi:hypothetical protein